MCVTKENTERVPYHCQQLRTKSQAIRSSINISLLDRIPSPKGSIASKTTKWPRLGALRRWVSSIQWLSCLRLVIRRSARRGSKLRGKRNRQNRWRSTRKTCNSRIEWSVKKKKLSITKACWRSLVRSRSVRVISRVKERWQTIDSRKSTWTQSTHLVASSMKKCTPSCTKRCTVMTYITWKGLATKSIKTLKTHSLLWRLTWTKPVKKYFYWAKTTQTAIMMERIIINWMKLNRIRWWQVSIRHLSFSL